MGLTRPFVGKPPMICNSDPEPVLMGGIKIFPLIGGGFGIGDYFKQLLRTHLTVRMEDLVGEEVFLSGLLPLYSHLFKIIVNRSDGNGFWWFIRSMCHGLPYRSLPPVIVDPNPKPILMGGIEIC